MNNIPNINYTLKHDICTGCGICEGVCPTDALKVRVRNERFLPSINDEKCNNKKGCHRCYDVCPGVGVNLTKMAEFQFNDVGMKNDYYAGRYIQCYSGYSNNYDIRYHSASGGLTTQFLIWLLEKKIIDGAVVTKFDRNAPLKVSTFIATTREELLSAKSSKYSPVSHSQTIQAIKSASKYRYIVVGVPCHIEGFRKAMNIDKKLREKIVGLFAIYCSSSRTFGFTKYIMKKRKINIDSLTYLAYRDNGCLGGLVAKGKNIDFYEDYQKYSHPLRSIFVPRRCLLCIDHYGELADISFGDIHVEPYLNDKIGVNSVIVRSLFWKRLLENAKQDGVITLDYVNIELINKSQPSAKMKKGRNMRFIYLLDKLGKKVPQYDTRASLGYKSDIIKYLHNRLQQFLGRNKCLWFLIPLIKKK